MKFKLHSKYQPAGDQPQAIKKLVAGYDKHHMQTLLGVTGSGKTFSVASVIDKIQKPTLILSPNKTLAAQLYNEFQTFFPENAVSYFVSYYDYYQPESYLPASDTYIEKDAKINDRIERLRMEAASNILTRDDVIVVSSISCIYGFGRPAMFEKYSFELKKGQVVNRDDILRKLVKLQFERNDLELKNGRFRVKGDTIDIVQGTSENVIRIEMHNDKIERLSEIHYLNGDVIRTFRLITVIPANPYLFEEANMGLAVKDIEDELKERLPKLSPVEAHRLKQKTEYDLEMIQELGYTNGIENYSRHLDRRKEGEPPYTLLDFFDYKFKKDWLMVIDESHVAIPQVHGMYKGDRSRKKNLIDNGFRLPSAYDNRPLMFDEFEDRLPHVIYTSATPGDYELSESTNTVEQIIRPTGLVDPNIEVRKSAGQMDDLITEIKGTVKKGYRTLVTTLTKRMSENLTEYLKDRNIKVAYLHSEIDTMERSKIIADLRRGKYDVLVGINLLREGLDLPEVALVAILDADKEGFLRNTRSLIQTIGRAARNVDAKVVLYADKMTESMKMAIKETDRRRKKQTAHNKKHGIEPKTIIKNINDEIVDEAREELKLGKLSREEVLQKVSELEEEMHLAAENLDFERAIEIREQLRNVHLKR